MDFSAANGVNVVFTDNGIIMTATDSENRVSSANVEELDFYTADGVVVTAADATEPVDISSCVVNDPGSALTPMAD